MSETTSVHDELAAMDKVAEALAPLSADAVERVIRWAQRRFAIGIDYE